jgi:RHS repeat-associated protein
MALSAVGGLSGLPVAVAQAPGPDLPQGSPPRGVVMPGVPVGTLGGVVSVGPSGGASWTTALKVVPGAGGMAPSLSVGYGGQGYGGVGVGFSLDGISSISRCARTQGQDGVSKAIDWSAEDRLCLDGERLVPVSGTYGADATEYRLRSAGAVRVIARGASTHPLSGFSVYTPDGRVSEYGAPSAGDWHLATVLANLPQGGSVPLVWSIHNVRDRSGNTMAYHYAGEATAQSGQLTPQDHRIESIEYGINAKAGLSATRRVAFGYATVSGLLGPGALQSVAIQRGYVAGVGYARTHVLNTLSQWVRTSGTGTWSKVREYELQYEPVPTLKGNEPPDQVRLTAMRECDGQENCFPDTRFEWSATPSHDYEPWPDFAFDGTAFYPPPAPGNQQAPYRRAGMQVLGDFDADGVVDMLVSPEWVNGDAGAQERWELWQAKPGASAAVPTNIPAWGATPWVNRTGGVVVPGSLVQEAQAPRTGHQRDGKAVTSAWAVNVDGTYGADVLIGRPQVELAGAPMDPPWGYGSQTWRSRTLSLEAPAYCTGYYALDMPGNTPAEVDLVNWGLYKECEAYLDRSPSDITGHPGIMSGFELWRLKPGTQTFEKHDLNYPAGRPALWAQPLDLNADQLTDLVFCKADANYGAAAGKALPMYYREDETATNWVSGTVHYAVSTPGAGLDLSNGGTQAAGVGGVALPCHLKDPLYVMELHGDGRESVLFRTHPGAGALSMSHIDREVPAGEIEDPYPYEAGNAGLTHYNQKLEEKIYGETELGTSFYRALTWSGAGVAASNTGLPYDEFMRWQGRGGNQLGRYSRFMPTQAGDVDAAPDWAEVKSNRRVGWGTPQALESGFGLGEARFADVNRDGLTDVLYVDLDSCHYRTDQLSSEGWPLPAARTCSYQDVMEFGRDLWEQTYEKLAVHVYANRGDGTFELIQSQRWWDTDLSHPQYSGKQLGDALTQGATWADAGEYAVFKAAWTIATTATRQWRTEFASSQVGDGNGDGAADLAYLATQFHPSGGWVDITMAGTYVVQPQWRVGRLGGGLREEAAPMMGQIEFEALLPGNQDTQGRPSWVNDGTLWVSDGNVLQISAYEQQEYGLPVRWQQADFNRDGVEDLMLYDHVEGRWRFARGKAQDLDAPAPQLLTAVVNGLGERTEIRYAPQHTLAATGTQWTDADLTLPYPLVSRPSTTMVVSKLRRDNGGEAQGEPAYNSTGYLYGKSRSDVLRGVGLGIDARETRQAIPTSSGVVSHRRVERYDNTSGYDEALQAYPLAGTLVAETSWVSGGEDEPIHLSHTGYRYEGKGGPKPGTWRRELATSAATTFEVPGDQADLAHKLFGCLLDAHDASQSCAGAEEAFQPLTHATQWFGYDLYGYQTSHVTESAGSTLVNERELEHLESLDAYVLGLPVLAWVAHEPEPGQGYTVRTTAHSYYPDGRLKETTVEPDRVEYRHSQAFKYDTFGNVSERWVASDDGQSPTFYAYSPSGVYATQVKNAKAHVTHSAWTNPYYEACGVAERVTGVAGHTQVTDIDTFCRTIGSASYYGTQPLAPKVSTHYAEWAPEEAEGYPDVDILVTTTIAGGASSHAIADRLGRNVVSQSPGFGFEVYTKTRYDALGRAEAVSLPTKVGEQPVGWTQTRFDALGRAREVTAADGTVTATGIDRYLTSVTDASGHTATSTMNALGQVVRVDPPDDPDQPNVALCYHYGSFGVLTRAEPCQAAAHKAPVVFEHDDYGRVTKVTSASLGIRTTRYDQLGRVWLTTDAKGQQTRFAYDNLGRSISRTEAYGTPGAKTASWLYDTAVPGALTEARNADGTVIERPIYDAYRRAVGLDTNIHGVDFRSRVAYDDRGRVAQTSVPSVDPAQAVTVTPQYNALDQMIGQVYAGHMLWEPLEANAFGQTVRQRYGNGLEATAEHDPLNGRLKLATVLKTVAVNEQPATQVAVEQFEYQWHANGLLQRRIQKGLLPNVSDQSDSFYYTPRGELKSWTTLGAAGAAQAWMMNYDGFGNVLKSPAGDYVYKGEQLASVDGTVGHVGYAYDANGNVTVRDHGGIKTVLHYDALNRVEGIQDGATQSTYQMTYSADGAKVHVRELASGRETFYLGGYQRETGGKLGSGAIERIDLGVAHLTRTWSGAASFEETRTYLTPADHLGSMTLVTDGNGLISERRSHGVWGGERNPDNWIEAKAPPADDVHGVAAGYTGHERKHFGALIDMKARYYDPLTQRMVQGDTVIPGAFNPLAWNAYAYTYNNPVAYTDPSGHAPQGGSSGGREFTQAQNMAALMDLMAGNEAFGNQYAAANGLPQLGGQTGMVNGGALGALRAIHLVRRAVELGGAMVADHKQQVSSAPRVTNYDMKMVSLFDRDWWGFVRAGRLPPFRTLEEYKEWMQTSPEARAAAINGQGMYAISRSQVDFVWGQLAANAAATVIDGGLRYARSLLLAGTGGNPSKAPASDDDALDAAAAAGGSGGGGRGWWPWRRRAAQAQSQSAPALETGVIDPGKVTFVPYSDVRGSIFGTIMHDGKRVGGYHELSLSKRMTIHLDAVAAPSITAQNALILAKRLVGSRTQVYVEIAVNAASREAAINAAQVLSSELQRLNGADPYGSFRGTAPDIGVPITFGGEWQDDGSYSYQVGFRYR